MDTTVTGMFADRRAAAVAVASLADEGFTPDHVRIIDSRTRNVHALIVDRTATTKRAVQLGLVIGAVAGVVTAATLIGALGSVWTGVLTGLGVAVGGVLLGLAVGCATTSQVKDELEHQVDSGTVLVSVTTNEAGAGTATALLERNGGSSIVATAATFTAGTLSAVPRAHGVGDHEGGLHRR